MVRYLFYPLRRNMTLYVQKGHPMPDSNACQLVLKYLLLNKDVFVKAFHNRLYSFSSGSKFSEVADALQDWFATAQSALQAYDPDATEVHPHPHTHTRSLTHSLTCTHIHTFNYQGDPPYDPKKVLKNLVDHDGLYNILGNTIIAFMSMKPQPYLKHALASKRNFWHVPTYKRAVTFVFLVRYVLGFKSQNQWKKFTSADYKLNTRCFKRFCTLEHKVFEKSDTYHELPDARESDYGEPLKRKSSSSFSERSPVKHKFVFNDDSTDED